MTNVNELACTYSTLILADDNVPITVRMFLSNCSEGLIHVKRGMYDVKPCVRHSGSLMVKLTLAGTPLAAMQNLSQSLIV